ncbi:MAG: Na/Pi symporter [Candidatus Omnitrophica bacterium]|nr:Na/Pi symporter [Candidatus Omnitrophota bacterium]
MRKLTQQIARIILIVLLLYLFLVSISLMSHSFKCFGKEFSKNLIATTSNPFIGLFIGVLATSIIQSSSTTTSIIVGFVAGGALSIRCAIPIIMGANIGTTVTNTLVALGHITRKEEFKRAFSSSTMHDLFNMLNVIIFFPLEMSTHILERTATFIASFLEHSGGFKLMSPVKVIVKPAVNAIDYLFMNFMKIPEKVAGILMLVVSLIVLVLSLVFLVKVMKNIIANKTEIVFDKILSRSGLISLSMGCLFTAIVQSSSVTTSLLVPLVGSGVLRLETAYPIVLGANLGTTVTAILASLTGNIAGITIAIVHLLFNLCGVLIFYPIKAIRTIPITLAKSLASAISEKRYLAFVYVGVVFFILPIVMIYVYNFLNRG